MLIAFIAIGAFEMRPFRLLSGYANLKKTPLQRGEELILCLFLIC